MPTDSDWIAYTGLTSAAWWAKALAAVWSNDVGALPRTPATGLGALDPFFRRIADVLTTIANDIRNLGPLMPPAP